MKTLLAAVGLVFCTAVLSGQDLTSGLVYQYDFAQPGQKLELKRKAKIADGVLALSGKGDYGCIPGSGNLHLTRKGLTLAATVKLNYDPGSKELPNTVDMFFSKGKEFIFGKLHGGLYVNFGNAKGWCAHTVFPDVPQSGEWAHVAAVIEYVSDPAQGYSGYQVSIYLNGELGICRKFADVEPFPRDNLIELGNGFGGGPWFMNGCFANARIYERALNGAEIALLCSREKRVKTLRKGFFEVRPELERKVAKVVSDGKDAAQQAAPALLRAARTGADQKMLSTLADLLYLHRAESPEKLAEKFNAAQHNCKILLNEKLMAMVLTGSGSGAHPVIEVLDRETNRSIFGEQTFAWTIFWFRKKQTGEIRFNSPGVTWDSSVSGDTVKIVWKGTGEIPFTAVSSMRFRGGRIESDFEVGNQSDCIFSAVRYPEYTFAGLGKEGRLVHPYMSGILLPNPLTDMFYAGQSGVYPSGRVSMQFGAYYNETSNRGVYFGYEDGLGRTKTYSAEGRHGNLQVYWENPVVTVPERNHFKMNGKAVIELYRGQWYEAGQIYRKFVEKEAVWWIPDLPRKSTPEWFRDNALWIRIVTKDDPKKVRETIDAVKYLRMYFGMPFCVHWYDWNEPEYGYPHFVAKKTTPALLKELKDAGLHVLPYVDDRLWKVQDGPGGKDWEYTSRGLKYAVKNRDSSVNQENYGRNRIYTIMCPAAQGWQDFLVSLTERMSDAGFSGLYHDQVGTAKPHLCFDRTHGHLPNDASLWLEQGYWPIFERIFKILHKKNRDFCHTTEENAEPYMKQFDGCLAARWVDPEQIPLYQSIYAGQIQFAGRLYNCIAPGDAASFFDKAAQQLVNAEQIGWFQPAELRKADERRRFIKKAAHLRKALLPWFNAGRMMAPIVFSPAVESKVSVWGGYIRQKVKLPVIASSAWEGADGSRMRLFVNTRQADSEANPEIENSQGFWICREGASAPVFAKKACPVRLKPLQMEVWLEGGKAQAEAIQKTLRQIASFDCGETAQTKFRSTNKKTAGVPGRFYGVADSAGNTDCNPTGDNSHFGWVQDGAVIAFGEIDFGPSGAKTVEVKVAVHPQCEGGSVHLLTAAPGKPEVVSAEIPLKSTGGWKKFEFVKAVLKQPLTGKHNVVFVINGNSACNFAGWKYADR